MEHSSDLFMTSIITYFATFDLLNFHLSDPRAPERTTRPTYIKTSYIYRSTLVSGLRRLTFTASETRSETICSRLQQYLLLRKMSGGKTSKSTNVVFEEKQGRLFSTGISRVFS